MSENIQVSCIRKRGNHFNPHERIEGLGGVHGGKRWYMPENDIIVELEKPAGTRPARRHVSLLELLIWTYRDQRAHHYLKDDVDFYLRECERQGIEVGAYRIAGKVVAERRPVHPDAVLVHAKVSGLYAARLIIEYAELGEQPERSIYDDRPFGWGLDPDFAAEALDNGKLPPKPCPVEPLNRQFSTYGRHAIDGRLIDYAILIAEQVTVAEEEWRPKGRKGCGRYTATARQVRVPVEYCPIDWRPGSEFIAFTNNIVAAWENAIRHLAPMLAALEFRDHVLIDDGAESAAAA